MADLEQEAELLKEDQYQAQVAAAEVDVNGG